MKAFIIHTPHEMSRQYATAALQSFEGWSGWEPELFEGLTPATLPAFEKKFPLKTKQKSRAALFFDQDKNKYTIKKCCSLNHYRLFRKCVEINEPIAVIEHDSLCVSDWPPVAFEDVLVLNILSAMGQPVFNNIRHTFVTPEEGTGPLFLTRSLRYKGDLDLHKAHLMPGTAAYAVTPQGAAKMIAVYETKGWEQSDYIINTGHVNIQTVVPELFTFKLPNLSMSHGQNMEKLT